MVFLEHRLHASRDPVDHFTFTLTETKTVALALRRLDRNTDLYLEDADNNVLASSTAANLNNEWLQHELAPGTYYARVQSTQNGQNDYIFRYGLED